MVYNESAKQATYRYRATHKEEVRLKQIFYSTIYRTSNPDSYNKTQIKYRTTKQEFAKFRNILLPDELVIPRKKRNSNQIIVRTKEESMQELHDIYFRYVLSNNLKHRVNHTENDTITWEEFLKPDPDDFYDDDCI